MSAYLKRAQDDGTKKTKWDVNNTAGEGFSKKKTFCGQRRESINPRTLKTAHFPAQQDNSYFFSIKENERMSLVVSN